MREAYRLMAEAREAARSDDNRRAAGLFAAVLEQHPSLRPELVREYADQLLWSDRAAEAHCGWVSGSSPLAIDIGR